MGLPVQKKRVTSAILNFLNERVLTVTQLTRGKKMSEILDSYAGKKSTDVYVVQNTKRPGKAIIADLAYFQELLEYKEAIDDAMDEIMEEVAVERKDTVADLSLAEVTEKAELDVDEIINLLDEVEEED